MSRLRTTRALLVGCGTTGVEQTQLDGFYMHRAALYEELGLVFRRVDTRDLGVLEDVLLRSHEDVAFVMVPWSHPVEDVVLLFRALRGRVRSKIVFLDYFAQTSSPYFAVLPYVDLYAKRQLLRERSAYARPMHGGYVFTDYLVKKQGYDIGSWHFGGPIPKEHAWKVRSAWNLGVKPIYRRMALRGRARHSRSHHRSQRPLVVSEGARGRALGVVSGVPPRLHPTRAGSR